MIREGRVTVDGVPARIGQKIDPATARVEVDGVPLPVAPELDYHLFYKPRGMVSTMSDPQGRPAVGDVAPPGVHPVGRLDLDSEGLMILTNDGDLTLRLTHPRYGVPKTYHALVRGRPTRATIRRLVEGVSLDDGVAAARTARIIDQSAGRSLVEVVMTEGRKREVRRMLEAVGHPVERLVRVAIGPVADRDLRPGTTRPLTVDEVRALYAAGEQR